MNQEKILEELKTFPTNQTLSSEAKQKFIFTLQRSTVEKENKKSLVHKWLIGFGTVGALILGFFIFFISNTEPPNAALPLEERIADYPEEVKEQVHNLPEEIKKKLLVPTKLPSEDYQVQFDVTSPMDPSDDTITLTAFTYIGENPKYSLHVTTWHTEVEEVTDPAINSKIVQLANGYEAYITGTSEDDIKGLSFRDENNTLHELTLVEEPNKTPIFTEDDLVNIANSMFTNDAVVKNEDENVSTLKTVLENTFNGPDQELLDIFALSKDDDSSFSRYIEYLDSKFKDYVTDDVYSNVFYSYLNYLNEQTKMVVQSIDVEEVDEEEKIYNFEINVQFQYNQREPELFLVTGQANFNEKGKIEAFTYFTDSGLEDALINAKTEQD
jgi:hypothetical protein